MLYKKKERQDFIFTIYHWWQALAIFTVYLWSGLPMKVNPRYAQPTLRHSRLFGDTPPYQSQNSPCHRPSCPSCC